MATVNGSVVCDNPTGPSCSPFTTYNFANQESVTIVQPSAQNTIVDGVTYDVVIEWTNQIGEVIDFSWEIYPDRKRRRFECENAKMWFDGIIVDTSKYFRGRRNDEPYCVFNMQNGILPNSLLQNPTGKVFFLLDNIMDDGDDYYIDKNRDSPVISSDNFNPNLYIDVNIICENPSGSQCNPYDNYDFSVSSVTIDYPPPANTDVVGGLGVFDTVVQWKPELGATIDHTWRIKPQRRNNNFDCSNSFVWLNGTVANSISAVDPTDNFPYCIFDIHNGLLNQSYIDNPGTTVFFLFDNIQEVSKDIYITRDFSIPIVSAENYDPIGDNPSLVCDDESANVCNVYTGFAFSDSVTAINFDFIENGNGDTTIVDGVEYDMVVKWIDEIDKDIEYAWKITPGPSNAGQNLDCSTSGIWINGTVYPLVLELDINGDDTCYTDINEGVLSQEIIDDPRGLVFFLLDRPLIRDGRELQIQEDFTKPVYSIGNYDPAASNPSIVCDDPDGPNCNVINDVIFAGDSVSTTYVQQTDTIVDDVAYDHVIKWNGPIDEVITYSWEVYPTQNNNHLTTCDNFKMWFNGTIVGSTLYFRGANNDEPYCVVDMQYGVLSDAILQDPSNKIFFLFGSETIRNNRDFNIDKNFDEPIVSRENIIFYLYDRIATTASTDNNLGTTFTVTVAELTYPSFPEFQGIGNCNTMETVMSSILIGDCNVDVETADNVNGVYTYFLPKENYYLCSFESEPVGNDIEFTTELFFSTGTPQCNYFNPLVASQSVVIEVPSNSMNGIDDTPRQGPRQDLLSYDIELCDTEDFPVPRFVATFEFNVSYSGDSVELYGTPKLDTSDNILSILNKTCTDTVQSGLDNYCIYRFKSSICRPLIAVNGGCSVDRFFTHTVIDFAVREVVDSGTGTAFVEDFGNVPTPIGLEVFTGDICTIEEEFEELFVTDQVTSTVKVRNRPNPDWNEEITVLSFYDPLIVQVSLDDTTDNSTSSNLEINSVEIIIRDSVTKEIINKYYFNRGNKLSLLQFSWSPYYKDVHFCNSLCGNFYLDNPNTTTVYSQSTIEPQLFDICQTADYVSYKDYFSFMPYIWFKNLDRPTVDIEINTISKLQTCDDSRRMLFTKQSTENKFVRTGATVQLITPLNHDGPPRIQVSSDIGKELEDTKKVTTALYITTIIMAIALSIVTFLYFRKSKVNHVRVSVIDF